MDVSGLAFTAGVAAVVAGGVAAAAAGSVAAACCFASCCSFFFHSAVVLPAYLVALMLIGPIQPLIADLAIYWFLHVVQLCGLWFSVVNFCSSPPCGFLACCSRLVNAAASIFQWRRLWGVAGGFRFCSCHARKIAWSLYEPQSKYCRD